MPEAPQVIDSKILRVRVENTLEGDNWQQAFQINHKLDYDPGTHKKGIYSPILTMLMLDDSLDVNEAKMEISCWGSFQFRKRSEDINEADLYTCLQFLCNRIGQFIKYNRDYFGMFAVELEESAVYNELNAFLRGV